ncbi:MAG TPA: glycosyltransferase family 4 protein [Vicinamibacterales bacterium]|nr:glycosyltransferase family 4 protein [Vicinamibacterales bacterium]
MTPAVHQALATLRYGDAISHQALGIRRVLRAAGFRSNIIAASADDRSRDQFVDYRAVADDVRADDLVINHFSVGSDVTRMAFALPWRMILNYHNITPPEFFVGIHDELARLCYQGRRELGAHRTRVDFALGASAFNRAELDAMGFAPTAVLPVVPDFDHLSGPADPWIGRAFDDDRTNVLFVGRIAPNKRQDNVIRHFAAYQRTFNPRSRLLLAGSAEGFARYQMQLQALARRLDAHDVHFLGQVTNEQLAALYEVADVFLSASEHEGFCVPLVEAFHAGVPVLALARAAVPATLDGGGVLYDTTDSDEVAALLHRLLIDDPWLARVLAAQDAALDRLEARDFGATLLACVEQVLAAPRRPMPPVPVTLDDFKAIAALHEVRETRPLAYHRLPPPPPPRARAVWPFGGRR